jgi:HEAT repeat protein
LQAALDAGTRPEARQIGLLVDRCAVEPDFFVRDMLTWALVRHPADEVVPRLIEAVRRDLGQARSQALHTLSKIRDPRAWSVITPELIADADDEVARAAWRAAVVVVPAKDAAYLAAMLATQLGRGDRDTRLSLSRALVALDESAAVVATATRHADPDVRMHALATQRLAEAPDEDFESALFEARRVVALSNAPTPLESDADR